MPLNLRVGSYAISARGTACSQTRETAQRVTLGKSRGDQPTGRSILVVAGQPRSADQFFVQFEPDRVV